MPILKGKKNEKRNWHEFRHGKTFKKTAAKFGKRRALKQMQAVVLGAARGGKKKPAKKRARKRA
jgi:hypothetical protein